MELSSYSLHKEIEKLSELPKTTEKPTECGFGESTSSIEHDVMLLKDMIAHEKRLIAEIQAIL